PITEPADMEPLAKKKVEEVEVFVVGLSENLDKKEHDNLDNKNPPHEEKLQPETDIEGKRRTATYHKKSAEMDHNNGKAVTDHADEPNSLDTCDTTGAEMNDREEFGGPQKFAVVDCVDERTNLEPVCKMG
ncbi:11803_t:CDS:1, partial [Racocetra persica]